MLRSLYDWTMRLGASRHAIWALAAIAFIESSFFPIPPDVLLIPMVLAARNQAWKLAGVCTLASVVGGYFGYLIGYTLFESFGQPIITFYGMETAFQELKEEFNTYGVWIVATFGATPLPYKLITITSGVTHLNPFEFGIASAVSRGARFFLFAALLWYFGPPIRSFVERYLGWVTLGFVVLLVGGFLAIKFLL